MNDLCPICKEKGGVLIREGRDFFVLDGNSDRFEVRFCENCHVGYTTPYLTDQELSRYYPENYEAYIPKKSLMARLQRLKYKGDLKKIGKKTPHNGEAARILEIGAGRGEFLAEARKIGFLVEGVEPGEAGRRFAKENLDIDLSGDLAAEIVYNKRYDVVVMRHVLEHLNQPVPVLERIIGEGLKPRGLLFLKIPRLDSWETRLFGRFCDAFDFPRHRVHFTKRGISEILSSLGYRDIKIRSEVVPTSILRSVRYYSRHGASGAVNFAAKAFTAMPYIVRFLICQVIGFALLPFGSGRMIVVAKKAEGS